MLPYGTGPDRIPKYWDKCGGQGGTSVLGKYRGGCKDNNPFFKQVIKFKVLKVALKNTS